jgi:hypothetical protein
MIYPWFIIISFTFLVILCSATHHNNEEEQTKEFCYSSYENDILYRSREILGRWERNQIYRNRGTFAYQSNPLEWIASACPVQARIFSCRRYDEENRAKKRIKIDFEGPTQDGALNNTTAHPAEEKHHGYDSLNQVFHVANCKLKTFDAETFLSLLRNRRFAIAGDSVSMQFAIMIICSLHLAGQPNRPGIKADYTLTWADHSKIFGKDDCMFTNGKFCHLGESSVYYPDYNVTIMYIADYEFDDRGKMHARHSLKQYYNAAGFAYEPPSSIIPATSSIRTTGTHSSSSTASANNRDIMLLNIGLHLRDVSEVSGIYNMISDEYNQTKANFLNISDPNIYSPPILIWRETSSQHFDTSESRAPSGYFDSKHNRHVTTPCVAYKNTTQAYLEDYRNRYADRWFNENNNIPIMRIANVTGLAVDQHIGKQHRSDTANAVDCTHFCDESGIFYYWREVLYNMLPIIINSSLVES